ncbi:protein phosphatase CheZ [Hwanghaeella grinnelliae]|nr:protein phosphatase CheZ [Hwanghaeella grinnelliae]
MSQKKQFRIEKLLKTAGFPGSGGDTVQSVEGNTGLLLQRVEALHEKIDGLTDGGGVAVGRSQDEDLEVRIEITRLVKEIGKTKAELASLRHPMADEDGDKIITATNELDAIVEATEKATNEILRSSEEITEILEKLRGDGDVDEEHRAAFDMIEARTIAILEACNFQDITGQRINKVVTTMQFIEERVKAMIDIWGVDAFAHLPLPEIEHVDEDAALLEGPQLENGLTQDDIDAMFD